MPELEARSVRVAPESTTDTSTDPDQLDAQQASPESIDADAGVEPDVEIPDATFESRYEQAAEFDYRELVDHYRFETFVDAVLDRMGVDLEAGEARLDDRIADPDDVELGALLAFPDETLLFVGSDPTAKDSVPWFAFPIQRHAPVPAPESAQAALDLLKTPEVRDIEHEDDWLAPRHGEWWLLPSDLIPGGTVVTPGVASKPYGPSPLGNHVPREFAFVASDERFMQRFHERVDAPESVATPREALEWLHRQHAKVPTPEAIPDWAEVREMGDEVLVRGTLRHRDDDHYVENLGDTWHRAQTHDFEVYTGDEVATDIHLDYHGL